MNKTFLDTDTRHVAVAPGRDPLIRQPRRIATGRASA